MKVTTLNNRSVSLRQLQLNELDLLVNYFGQLSDETKRRFSPHPFDLKFLEEFYRDPAVHLGYIAADLETGEIIAYTVVKLGYLEHDAARLRSYGMTADHRIDCTFAPSVADTWQSCGIGSKMFHYIVADLKPRGVRRIILWGGVQKDNEKAVNFYLRNQFRLLGEFDHNGLNFDMVYLIN